MADPTLFALPKRKRSSAPTPSLQEQAARAILAALWPRVRFAIGSVMTQTAWRARNKKHALDMAECGVSPERACEAHAAACTRLQQTVYSLFIVQNQLLMDSARKTPVTPLHGRARADLPVASDSYLATLR